MKALLLFVFLVPGISEAAWTGKMDLTPVVQPLILREAHDGQWLYGYSHYVWLLAHGDNVLFHAGLFNAYNAERGNGSFGPLVGADLIGLSKEAGVDIPTTIASLGEWTGLPNVFKPAVLFSEMLGLDAFVGYRPIHTLDVNGEFVYGGAAALKIPFGVKELKSGL